MSNPSVMPRASEIPEDLWIVVYREGSDFSLKGSCVKKGDPENWNVLLSADTFEECNLFLREIVKQESSESFSINDTPSLSAFGIGENPCRMWRIWKGPIKE